MVSKYHPDVNPHQDAHLVLVEINEAYEILSDPDTKWLYDQYLLRTQEAFNTIFKVPVQAESRKRRQGVKETEEKKQQKKAFAIRRNTSFNQKMKLLSILSLITGGLIFTDHYLPTVSVYEPVYASFKPEQVSVHSDASVSIFLNKGRKLEVYPVEINEEAAGLRKGEALFKNTPVFNVMKTVQVGKLVLKPFDSLYNIMLLFGGVCLCSIFVLAYKKEESLVLPTILTFFDIMLVLTFFTMWYMEG